MLRTLSVLQSIDLNKDGRIDQLELNNITGLAYSKGFIHQKTFDIRHFGAVNQSISIEQLELAIQNFNGKGNLEGINLENTTILLNAMSNSATCESYLHYEFVRLEECFLKRNCIMKPRCKVLNKSDVQSLTNPASFFTALGLFISSIALFIFRINLLTFSLFGITALILLMVTNHGTVSTTSLLPAHSTNSVHSTSMIHPTLPSKLSDTYDIHYAIILVTSILGFFLFCVCFVIIIRCMYYRKKSVPFITEEETQKWKIVKPEKPKMRSNSKMFLTHANDGKLQKLDRQRAVTFSDEYFLNKDLNESEIYNNGNSMKPKGTDTKNNTFLNRSTASSLKVNVASPDRKKMHQNRNGTRINEISTSDPVNVSTFSSNSNTILSEYAKCDENPLNLFNIMESRTSSMKEDGEVETPVIPRLVSSPKRGSVDRYARYLDPSLSDIMEDE